tara:strand:+ start:12892 stop:15054 length:2163 start_codon:yes stop_codon:yes gene_type:complete
MRKITLFFAIVFCCSISAQVIHVKTNKNSLVYNVTKSKKVHQAHYGKRLNSTEGISNLKAIFNEAYPSFGNGRPNEVALLVKHDDGTLVTDLFYLSHDQNTKNGIQYTSIHLKDEKKNLFVDLHFKAYRKENVIEQWVSIINKESKAIELQNFASSAIGFKAREYYLLHFYGSWRKEMQMVEEKLTNGIKVIETKQGVRATEYENPSFMLSLNKPAQENSGEVIAGALAWSGNYKLTFQLDEVDRCQVTAGINPFASQYTLQPNQEFTTPRMIYTFSYEGKNQASINLHRWARKYNLRAGDEIRPIILNSWEGAYFDFDAKLLKGMMDGAAEMGVEYFILDDGWFGNKYPRNLANAGLGDWQVNKKKLPNGISDLIDHAEKKGLKFGIWVEPEMANPKSELAENQPDWIIQRKNNRKPMLQKNQLLLDLSNPKVQDFVYNVVSDILKENPRITYIKWDANRSIQNYGSTYLTSNNQSHLWIDYAKALEVVFAKLGKNHPKVIFQASASGGARVEYGILKNTHEFWTSDDTDPIERIFIQWGTNHIYPPIASAAHVTSSPNHQTGRATPLKFRFDVAMGGRLGVELSPTKLNSEELEYAKKAIQIYKDKRHIIQFGDLYRLLSPYDDDGYAAINYVTENKDEAILFVYCLEYSRRSERNVVKPQGIDPKASYLVEEINMDGKNKISAHKKVLSAEVLMNRGIDTDLRKPFTSVMIQLTKVK